MRDVALYRVKIFANGADRASILDLAANPLIKGFTTNPTLMRKAGIADYEAFGRSLAREIPNRPFSFEVLSDDFDQMGQQALEIATWGGNVYVKIPITDTRGRSSAALVKRLSRQGVKLNVTALMTLEEVAVDEDAAIAQALAGVEGIDAAAVIAALDAPEVSAADEADKAGGAERRRRGHRVPGQGRRQRRQRPLHGAIGDLRDRRRALVSSAAASSRSRPTTCCFANLDTSLERHDPAGGRPARRCSSFSPRTASARRRSLSLLAGNLVEGGPGRRRGRTARAGGRRGARRANRSATTRSLARGLSARPIRMTTPPRTPG